MKITKYDKPFPHWIVDGYVCDAYIAVGEIKESLLYSPKLWNIYDNVIERKRLIDDPMKIGRWSTVIAQTDWRSDIQKWTGLDTSNFVRDPTEYGGSIHAMVAGDYLGCYLDQALHPKADPPLELRLAMVCFLVPPWQSEWSGTLDLYDDMGQVPVSQILPAPGRIVIWESTDLVYHGVSQVAHDCPAIRATANCFYYAPARPGAVRKRALFVPPRNKISVKA